MPRIVTRPVIASIASATRRSRRMVVRSRHWLKQAKSTIISGMGGCSLCRVGLGNPYSTRYSTALFHLHTVLSRPVSSPFLAKVLYREIVFYILTVVLSYSLYQLFANTQAGIRFTDKTRHA